MKQLKFVFLILLVGLTFIIPNKINAQESEKQNDFNLYIFSDITSRYLWRGTDSPATLTFQPGISFEKGNFSFGAWGATDVGNQIKEFDLNISYFVKGFTFTLNDYFYNPQKKYFNFESENTGHVLELAFSYQNENFPLKIYAGTMLWGEDKKFFYDVNEMDFKKHNYSTYLELTYSLNIKDNSVDIFAAATPFTGMYGNDFAVIYTGLTATKNIEITDKFSLPLYATFATNPQTENYFVMLGIKL